MANIWKITNDDRWVPTELRSAIALRQGSINSVERRDLADCHGEVIVYPSTVDARDASWMLLAATDRGVRINGTLLETGMCVLADRDAIRVGDLPAMYFSTERLARIEPFPGGDNVFCPRDKTLIAEGDAAVCCPNCGTWLHEQLAEGKGCWSYAATCAVCDQSTDLDYANFRWTPGGL